MPIDRPFVKEFHSKLNDTVKEFARQNNLTCKSGSLRYDDTSMRVTLTFAVEQSSSEVMISKKKEWYVHCRFYDLAPEDFGETIVMGGETFTITGLNLKSKRNAVELKRVRDGKMYRSTSTAVRVAFRLADRQSPVNAAPVMAEGLSEVSE